MADPDLKRAGTARQRQSGEFFVEVVAEAAFWLALVLIVLGVVGEWIWLVLLGAGVAAVLWREWRRQKRESRR